MRESVNSITNTASSTSLSKPRADIARIMIMLTLVVATTLLCGAMYVMETLSYYTTTLMKIIDSILFLRSDTVCQGFTIWVLMLFILIDRPNFPTTKSRPSTSMRLWLKWNAQLWKAHKSKLSEALRQTVMVPKWLGKKTLKHGLSRQKTCQFWREARKMWRRSTLSKRDISWLVKLPSAGWKFLKQWMRQTLKLSRLISASTFSLATSSATKISWTW